MKIFSNYDLPSPPISVAIDWWQLIKLHNRTLSETLMTTRPPGQSLECLAMNLTRAVQYQGGGSVWIGGPYPSRGTSPPQSRHVPPIHNILVPPSTDFCPLPDNKFSARFTHIHYLYNIFVNKIRYYWIGEQYTSLCC